MSARSVILAVLVVLASPAVAQTLYSLSVDGAALQTVDPADGSTVESIGGETGNNKGLAMYPSNGLLYSAEGPLHTDPWTLVTVDSTDGSESTIGNTGGDEKVRSLVFDAAGTLWAVTGADSANADALVTLDPSTGAPTVRNASLPTDKNKLAYRRGWDRVYLLGRGTPNTELYWFSPADPSTLHPVALSGDALDATKPFPGFVYEPYGDRFLGGDDLTWFELTPDGVVNELSSSVGNTFGLAFDAVTTAYTKYVFIDGFDLDGACTWTASVGGPSC